jgi:hypothetical protein
LVRVDGVEVIVGEEASQALMKSLVGELVVTTERVFFVRESAPTSPSDSDVVVGWQLSFSSILVHGVAGASSGLERPCVVCDLDDGGDGGDEAHDASSSPSNNYLRLVPREEADVQRVYDAMCEGAIACSADQDEGDVGEFAADFDDRLIFNRDSLDHGVATTMASEDASPVAFSADGWVCAPGFDMSRLAALMSGSSMGVDASGEDDPHQDHHDHQQQPQVAIEGYYDEEQAQEQEHEDEA